MKSFKVVLGAYA